MRAIYGGRNCTTERYTLATKVGNVPFPYRNPVYIYTPRPLLWVAGPSVAQAELKAGKYYIVNYSCYIKRQYQSITLQLLPANRIVNSQTQFKDAIASFTVKPGEVVNVGRLSFANAGNVGGYGYSRTNAQVSDLTKEQYDWLAENKPNIYGKMVKRTMVRVRR